MFFQTVVDVWSPVQVVLQVAPALKLSPGAGVRGVTSAHAAKGAARARRAVKACAANIFSFGLLKWAKKIVGQGVLQFYRQQKMNVRLEKSVGAV